MKDKVENGTKLSEMNTGNVEANGNTEAAGNTSVSCLTRIWSFFTFFTVEPYLLCYIMAYTLIATTELKFKMEKACRADLNYTEDICGKMINGDTNDNMTMEAQIAASKLTTDISAWQLPLQSSVPVILILFVGAWSDRTGNRKALMLIPIIGEFIATFGLLLATYYFLEWPLRLTALIEALPSALGGGYTFAMLGSFSFIADVTTLDSRTFRMAVVAVIITLGGPLATYLSGVLTQSLGYFAIFGIGMAVNVMAFVYTCFRVHNVRNDKIEGTLMLKLINFFHPRNVWDTISLLLLTPGRQRIQIILVVCAHFVTSGPDVGTDSVIYTYVLNKYKMSHLDYTLFGSYKLLIGVAATTFAVTIFSKVLKMHDSLLGILATTTKIASKFVYGMAPTREWLYSAPAFNFFGGSAVIANKSLATKVVDPADVGKMTSLIALANGLIPIVYIPICNKLLSNTVDTNPEAVFFLAGAMLVPAIFIFLALYIMHKKEERDVVKNLPAKEMHAYNNDVTVL